MEKLEILYQDDFCVVVDKPAGLLVHRTHLARADEFALQILRNQLKQWVYPVHRLDRPTSGVLLFAKSSEFAQLLCQQFSERQVRKKYLALVRGFIEEEGCIDYPLKKENAIETQEAQTYFRCLKKIEFNIPVGRYASSRYSLVEAFPRTGRRHQIRRHFAHIFHPIIGDTTHGDGKHNRMFREQLLIQGLFLNARELTFFHPHLGEEITVQAPLDLKFIKIFPELNLDMAAPVLDSCEVL
ncbi:MAG: hypothetical protein COB67_05450 [SAR324 cluster bacterium]|uniref:tRNA pseudouridine synthase C n=1 Tax=SAR324 cluster bacterium TaxID=2024889 RepID=A0A2A4T784_9DELT|nr:MAG: hypothetical protein COB67_05450 [SAR324 cluster bacterium]